MRWLRLSGKSPGIAVVPEAFADQDSFVTEFEEILSSEWVKLRMCFQKSLSKPYLRKEYGQSSYST